MLALDAAYARSGLREWRGSRQVAPPKGRVDQLAGKAKDVAEELVDTS